MIVIHERQYPHDPILQSETVLGVNLPRMSFSRLDFIDFNEEPRDQYVRTNRQPFIAVVVVDSKSNSIVMLEQFKYAYMEWYNTIPVGGVKRTEVIDGVFKTQTFEETIVHEVETEAGVKVDLKSLQFVGQFNVASPDKSVGEAHYFVIVEYAGVITQGDKIPEKGIRRVALVPPKEFIPMVHRQRREHLPMPIWTKSAILDTLHITDRIKLTNEELELLFERRDLRVRVE